MTNQTQPGTTDLTVPPTQPPRAQSLAHLFLDRVTDTPQREAFRYPDGEGWQSVTWQAVSDRARHIAAGLLALGISPGDRVAIASSTRYEWILAHLGILSSGGATTAVYPTTGAHDVHFILADSASRVLFAEDDEQIDKLLAYRSALPTLTTIVTFDGTADDESVISLADLERLGQRHLADRPSAVDDAIAGLHPESLATLIYTSGTTGLPKGVRLVHDCWVYEGAAIAALGLHTAADLHYLWLPLSHSYGQLLLTAQIAIGYASAVDGQPDRLVKNLAAVRPTMMAAPPRMFEKIHGRVVATARAQGTAKARIFDWAFSVGTRVSQLRRDGKRPTRLLALQHAVANRLVFTKLRDRFGGRIRYLISGGAPLHRDLAEWFHAAGILVLEGYGLTETSACTTFNRPDRYRFGTVGQPLPGTEVRISGDGELLIKGPGVMRGYHNLPDQTAQVLTPDGWLHTGDIGETTDGFVRITDRKKDLIKTAGGKYVAPQPIEARFKTICPYAAHLIVHGDQRAYVTALVTLDPDSIGEWAQQHGMTGQPYPQIVTSNAARTMVQGYIDQLNDGLNPWETIKKFAILPDDLTVNGGGLTPSLKVRRHALEAKHAHLLNALYS